MLRDVSDLRCQSGSVVDGKEAEARVNRPSSTERHLDTTGPGDMARFFKLCRDDEEVQFENLLLYAQRLPRATVREIANGGHQLNNDLTIVPKDIKSL